MARHIFWASVMVVALILGASTSASAATRAAKIHVEPNVNFTLPPTKDGCSDATRLAGGAARFPITVSKKAGQVAELVNVCIDGKGPFAFIVDSGAGESIIAANLARQLHLRHDGSSSQYGGVGCTGTAQPVEASNWSVAGIPLHGQTLTAATLPEFGGKGQPVGLLGSDVFDRFGAIRIDFTAQTLTLGGPEGPVPSNSDVVKGPQGPPPSAVLTDGEVGITVPLTVVLTPGIAALNVQLRFGDGPNRTFTVDTGSSQSLVNISVAKEEHLAHTDLAQRQATVCSMITTPLVRSGAWSIPGVNLHPQLIDTASFGPISEAGLLGSDQLIRFGWVVFDYTGGRMVLG